MAAQPYGGGILAGMTRKPGNMGRKGQGQAGPPQVTHPDTQVLVVMVIVEALALVGLRRMFRGAHGG